VAGAEFSSFGEIKGRLERGQTRVRKNSTMSFHAAALAQRPWVRVALA
jgi:hypothetical protein